MLRAAVRTCLLIATAAGLSGCAELNHLMHVFLPAPSPSFTDTEFRLEDREPLYVARRRPAPSTTSRPAQPVSLGMQPRSGLTDEPSWVEPALVARQLDGEPVSIAPVASGDDLNQFLRSLDDLVDESLRLQESLLRLHATEPD
jgi:hypothetical protein